MLQVKNAVYLNEDKTQALPRGHADARSLLVGPNGSVTDEVAKRYNLTESGAPDQGEAAGVQVLLPSGVSEHSADGINTLPGSAPAMGVAETAAAETAAAASEPNTGGRKGKKGAASEPAKEPNGGQ